MILLVISLILSFVITVFGIVFKDDKGVVPSGSGIVKRIFSNTKLRNGILILLNFLFLFVSFKTVKNEMKEGDRLKSSVAESKKLLEEANVKMTKQSDLIISGFTDLKNQMQKQGVLSGNIDKRISTLALGIETYTSESQNLFSNLNQSLSTKTQREFFTSENSFYIPSGHKNTIKIDSKNFIALISDDEEVLVQLNTRKYIAKPAVPIHFYDENRNLKYIVYNGRVENKHEFSLVTRK